MKIESSMSNQGTQNLTRVLGQFKFMLGFTCKANSYFYHVQGQNHGKNFQ